MANALRVTASAGSPAAKALWIVARVLVAVAVAVVPPALTHQFLQATGPLTAVVVWSALLAALVALAPEAGSARRGLRWAVVLVGAFGALVLIADMVIIPLSAYLLWFELVPEGNARGAVSFVYVMLVAFGSALFGGALPRRPAASVAGYLAWLSFLSVPVLNRAESVYALAGAAVALVAAIVIREWPGRLRARATVHAVLMLGLSVAAAAGLGRVSEPDGSRVVDDFLSPRFRDAVVTLFPAFPIVYDVPGYGYRFSSTDLSRTPVLSNRALFRVGPMEGGSVYLRTEVFHRFTGSGWQVDSSLESVATDDLVLAGESPGGRVPLRSDGPQLDEPTQRTEVTVLADFYSLLPHTLDTAAVAVSGRDELRFERSGEALGYQLTRPLLYGDRVSLYRTPRRAPAVPADDADAADAPAAEVYLSVPDDLPDEVRQIAVGLTGDTPSETIVNTLRYLRDGFEYTLEPPPISDRDRFLPAFLQEHRRGFCVHYATAFTVLARLQGIPARYVSGFLVRSPQTDVNDPTAAFDPTLPTDVLVSGYSAHAWAEIYLPDVGWRIVEATPPMQPVGYENTFFDRFASVRNEGRTYSQLAEILGQEIDDGDERWRLSLRLPSLPLWSVAIPLALLVAAAVWLFARTRAIDRRFLLAVRRVRAKSVRAGFPSPERVGWTGWARRGGRHSSRVARVVLRVFFGDRRPTRRDVRFIRAWARERL